MTSQPKIQPNPIPLALAPDRPQPVVLDLCHGPCRLGFPVNELMRLVDEADELWLVRAGQPVGKIVHVGVFLDLEPSSEA